ncbi:hypothetical protein LEP1GSC168_0849 [Leptospira santarosai str. HAI134]|nr:hypothetical protein LEP1GSC168_0849 [Leptospira santarosai str. HAI134]
MSQADLSAFMTKNFMNTHAGIKSKLIEQEKANVGKPRKKKYARIGDEIVETIGVYSGLTNLRLRRKFRSSRKNPP